MKQVEIKLFGAFRKYIPAGVMSVQVEEGVTVKALKDKIHSELCNTFSNYKDMNLVFESALATDSDILNEDSICDLDQSLALLPPVCGG